MFKMLLKMPMVFFLLPPSHFSLCLTKKYAASAMDVKLMINRFRLRFTDLLSV